MPTPGLPQAISASPDKEFCLVHPDECPGGSHPPDLRLSWLWSHDSSWMGPWHPRISGVGRNQGTKIKVPGGGGLQRVIEQLNHPL